MQLSDVPPSLVDTPIAAAGPPPGMVDNSFALFTKRV
jgi:hypothetical protein